MAWIIGSNVWTMYWLDPAHEQSGLGEYYQIGLVVLSGGIRKDVYGLGLSYVVILCAETVRHTHIGPHRHQHTVHETHEGYATTRVLNIVYPIDHGSIRLGGRYVFEANIFTPSLTNLS